MRANGLWARHWLVSGYAGLLLAASPAEAAITRIEITRVESPTFAGATFGGAGQYEKLVGRAYGEVDPRDHANRIIQDLSLAPRNARGMVEYVTDIYILKPVDLRRGNGILLFDFMNRGNKRSEERRVGKECRSR